MYCFEGYVPKVGESELDAPLSELIRASCGHGFEHSIWSDDSSEADWNKNYTTREYLDLFEAGRIHILHFDYSKQTHDVTLSLKLMFDRDTSLEIICYREPILKSPNRRDAVRYAIDEFRVLRQVFRGSSLFVGPDTSSYPKSDTDYPNEWMKIE